MINRYKYYKWSNGAFVDCQRLKLHYRVQVFILDLIKQPRKVIRYLWDRYQWIKLCKEYRK